MPKQYKETYSYQSHIYHKIYRAWCAMKERCYSSACLAYKYYGERGIIICDEWLNDFEAFLKWSLENGWVKGLSIDREDNDGNYEPDNCRWITIKEQSYNRGKSRNNKSNYTGVSFYRKTSKWESFIIYEDKKYYLGLYNTKKEALETRNKYIEENNLPHHTQKYIGE